MKRLLATFIIVIMLISQLAIVVNASQVEGLTEKTKITNQLKEKMDSAEEGEYIPIYIWLNSHDDFVVYEALSRTYSERINADNEQMLIDGRTQKSFEELKAEVDKVDKEENQDSINTKFDKKKKHIRENTALGSKLSDSQIERFLENEDEQREIVANVEQTQYISEWRSARYNINQFINREFEKRLNMEKCRNVNLDIQLAFVELEATKDYIYELEKLYMVESIGLSNAVEIAFDSQETNNETETGATASNSPYYHMYPMDDLNEYDGTGIKIGVIELAKKNNEGKYMVGYKQTTIHLHQKEQTGKIVVNFAPWENRANVSGDMKVHAEAVLQIICGNLSASTASVTLADGSVLPAGTQYSGLAPNATVYFTSFMPDNSNADLKKSIYWCVQNDVSVINMSFGATESASYYNEMDQYIDCVVTQYRVCVVKSAGNNETNNNVTNPGLGYNVITVGNMTAKTDVEGKYIIIEDSCFNEQDFLPNKPDICAFGTNICMLDGLVTIKPKNWGFGTSYAAPMVTGTIAKMMHANSQLIGNPDTVKAILLSTASANVSTAGNEYAEFNTVTSNGASTTIEQGLREKTGAGLLNVSAAVECAENIGQLYNFVITENDVSKVTNKYYFDAGDKIRATLVFEKNHYEMVNGVTDVITNLDFVVKNSAGTVVASSTSLCNNVDSVEITFNASGYYYFEILNESTLFDKGTRLPLLDSDGDVIYNYEALNSINTTFILNCSCDMPVLQEEHYNASFHKIECVNCNTEFEKKHDENQHSVNINNGTIIFTARYLSKTVVAGWYYSFYCFNLYITSNMNGSCTATVTLNSTNEYVMYGNFISENTYNVTVKNSSGNVVETKTVSIMITKNQSNGTVTIEDN